MKIFKEIQSLRQWRKTLSNDIGFVPTMGALHEGHLSLIKESKENCKSTIVSIYVNPLQFNNTDDLKNYPSTIDNDIELLKTNSVDAIFLPTNEIMYSNTSSTFVEEIRISNGLEGESRPGHFKGVATIVAKFFNIIQPTHAFFGEKDAQQLRIIQRMVKDLDFDINIIPCETIREKSGLAMSSRNKNLTIENKEKACIIKKGLDLGKIALDNGEKSVQNLKKYIRSKISSEENAEILYVSIAESETLIELNEMNVAKILISVAVKFGNVRLVDNFTYSVS